MQHNGKKSEKQSYRLTNIVKCKLKKHMNLGTSKRSNLRKLSQLGSKLSKIHHMTVTIPSA